MTLVKARGQLGATPRRARTTSRRIGSCRSCRHIRNKRFENWVPAFAGTSDTVARSSIPPEQADQLALDAHAVGGKDAHLIGGIGWLERDRGTAAAETLERCLLVVDQRHDDIAGIGGFS